jgi:hypothetical protein
MGFKIMTISLADHIIDRLQKYCDKTGQKPTDVIRQAVFEFLDNICAYPYNSTDLNCYNINTIAEDDVSKD